MATRAEITTKYARQYKKTLKKNKGAVLDEVIAVTGWTRDNARRRLARAAIHPPGPGRQVRKSRASLGPGNAPTTRSESSNACGRSPAANAASTFTPRCGSSSISSKPTTSSPRPRPLHKDRAQGTVSGEPSHDRPVPGACPGQGRDQRDLDDETREPAAFSDHDPACR